MYKKQNVQEVKYLKEINQEIIKINEKLNNTLTELIRKGENLDNYKLLVNEKCHILIKPIYIIEKISMNLEKEGFAHDTAYVIVKNTPEAEEVKNETIIL